jgi:hypothetical protein
MADEYILAAIEVADQALDDLVNWDASDIEGFKQRAMEAVVIINNLKSQDKKEHKNNGIL